jgi:uncharacterized Zn-binding protein involved in type VI secretion
MAGPVIVNGLTVVHRGSGGMAMATVPDVCKTPSSAGPIPIPYPNLAQSSDLISGTTTVTVCGQSAAIQGSKLCKSTGDEAGSLGGVASGVFIGEASFISFSPNVFFEGKPVVRLTDKLLMNKGNTVCAAGIIQAPAFTTPAGPAPADATAAAAKPLDPQDIFTPYKAKAAKPCTLDTFELSCGHAARKFTLDALKTQGNIFQILSGTTNDSVTLKLLGHCGFRQASQSDCPWLEIRDSNGKLLNKKGDRQVKFPRPGKGLVGNVIEGKLWWANYVFSFDSIPIDYYTVTALTCDGEGDGRSIVTTNTCIQVFPNFSWKGEVSLGYEHAAEPAAGSGAPLDKGPLPTLSPKGTIGIGGKLEITFGDSTKKIEPTIKAKAGQASDWGALGTGPFRLALAFLQRFAGIFESLNHHAKVTAVANGRLNALVGKPADKIEIKWPKVTFGGGTELAEAEGNALVNREGEIHIKFDPLIGFEVSTDIFEWLIRFASAGAVAAGPALASFLLTVKHWAAGDEDADPAKPARRWKAILELRLSVEGSIGGGISWKWKTGKLDPDQGLLEAKVGFKLVGRAYGEIRVWRVSARGCAQISAQSDDGKDVCGIIGRIIPKRGKTGFVTSGELKFTGLAIYYLLYFEYGSAAKEADLSAAKKDKDFELTAPKESKTRKEKTERLATDFTPKTRQLF